MKKIIILCTMLTVMITSTCNGAGYNYTWKDANGVLNITDYAPPEDAEIIGIEVIPIQDNIPANFGIQEQDELQDQSALQNRQRQIEAASLRKEAAKLRQDAANIAEGAKELSRIANLQKRNRRLLVLSNSNTKKAEEQFSQADSLVRRAEELEQQASQLK